MTFSEPLTEGGTPKARMAPLSPTSTGVGQGLNYYENRGLGPPPPLPPRSTRPDYVSVERTVDRDTEAPQIVVDVSDSESDAVGDLEHSLTLVEISDSDSDFSAELIISEAGDAKSGDAKSAADTNAGVPPAPRGTTESHLITKKSSLVGSTNPHRPFQTGSTSSSGGTPRRGKQVFYVVTKGRRTGVFDSWLYVDSLVKGIDSTYKSYKDKEEAIEQFLMLKRMGLVKQTGMHRPDLVDNAPEDLSAEYY